MMSRQTSQERKKNDGKTSLDPEPRSGGKAQSGILIGCLLSFRIGYYVLCAKLAVRDHRKLPDMILTCQENRPRINYGDRRGCSR
mmetsp:Transcript_26080/g.34036  ORF Transcript_26080/g.34036 Transcript_26080/m.34036 type:complete len:85 (-) Transcript_26080:541-795(-)